MKRIIVTVLVLALIGGVAVFFWHRSTTLEETEPITSLDDNEPIATSTEDDDPATIGSGEFPTLDREILPEILTTDLNIPWDIAFLPDGWFLVTERPGTIALIDPDGDLKRRYNIRDVKHTGEGGLLGLVLHPDFETNEFLYLYVTQPGSGNQTENTVERYRYANGELVDRRVILNDIPGAKYHDGGRMEFGPDGKLYITTGDATDKKLAQDLASLAGKVLRLNDDGSIPADNPFPNSPVYSYGHRNPQGLAWDSQGRLWETEHGPSGFPCCRDELNLIEAGKNYGWPEIQGDETKSGMEAPILQSGTDVTWAPASATYLEGSIFFGGLRGVALYEADISGSEVVLKEHLKGEYGRIRTVRLGPDGMFYVTTSNTDGRADAREDDDILIRINPASL